MISIADHRSDADVTVAATDLAGMLLLPAMAEPHAHLDKALTAERVPNPTGDLAGAIDAWIAAAERGDLRRGVAPELAARVALASAAAALADPDRPLETVRNELLHVLLHGMAEPKPRLKWTEPTRES